MSPLSHRSNTRLHVLVLLFTFSALLLLTDYIFRSVEAQSPAGVASSVPLLISEFRLRGPNGANDEFVEIYNNSDFAHTVNSTDGTASG